MLLVQNISLRQKEEILSLVMDMETFLPCKRFSSLFFVKIYAQYANFCNHVTLLSSLAGETDSLQRKQTF